MRNARLDEAQTGIKIARRNINNLRYANDTIVMAESKEELKNLLMKALVLGSEITTDNDCSYDKPRQHIKRQRYYFVSKGPYSQSYGFSNNEVWM